MTTELTYLAWTLVLAIVQILLSATLRTGETGLPYAAGSRDLPSPVGAGLVTGRCIRAQRNLFETLPIFAAAVLAAHAAGISTPMTACGATLYFWSRVVYIPLYAFGIKYLRTLVWAAGLVGIGMLLAALLHLA